MHETELADPYMTPRTLPVRRPYKFLVYGSILAIVLLSAIAIVFMFYRAASAKMQLNRSGPVNFNLERLPVQKLSREPPASVPDTAVP